MRYSHDQSIVLEVVKLQPKHVQKIPKRSTNGELRNQYDSCPSLAFLDDLDLSSFVDDKKAKKADDETVPAKKSE
jgi:hypothetical protein